MHASILRAALVALAGGSLALAVERADAFSGIVAFGDSLSDDGNVYQLTQGYPNNPLLPFPSDQYYVGGRQSNGPVAVEYLSSALGVPLHNFAQAGATTGMLNVWDDGSLGAPAGTLGLSGMLAQVQSYVAQPGASDPNALYLLWGGPNDFVAGLANPATFDPVATISAAMTNLSNEAGLLYGDGARNFLVPSMADLGLAPRVAGAGLSDVGTLVTGIFNAYLDTTLAGLRANLPGATVYGFDSVGLSEQIFDDFSGGNPAAPEVTTPCLSVAACVADPQIQATFYFWDDAHPTTQAHSIFGREMAAAVPEPETWALLIAGLGLVGWRRRLLRGMPA